ncbi:MAG: aminotransferase class V-fold PLP-dependent enzyme [Bryobacterales bacterium]|nr:aminotransferase class V-fold PLP-dependent enzyme [Bryobacterales bacterium]
MQLDRRGFLAGASSALFFGCGSSGHDFPWSKNATYLNNAGWHPCYVEAAGAARRYLDFTVEGRGDSGVGTFRKAKELYGKLINAKESELSFVQSTLTGENLVSLGLGLHEAKGNVVTDELHYHGGAYIYRRLQERGLELRLIRQKDWRISLEDYERAIDGNTRLVALTLVSNINGYMHDAAAVSGIAHSRGAYVYADVVQSAGCVPMDVRAMGIDFCSASTYKWLMGLRGLGFFYVREELQGKVLKPVMFGDRQYADFEFHNFPGSPPGSGDVSYHEVAGGEMFEVGNVSNIAIAAQVESLRYIHELGVDKILAHARPLCERLMEELPKMGYPCITPPGSPTPIVAFLVENPEETQARLKKANVVAKIKWRQMRISPSVYNTMADVEKLLRALA